MKKQDLVKLVVMGLAVSTQANITAHESSKENKGIQLAKSCGASCGGGAQAYNQPSSSCGAKNPNYGGRNGCNGKSSCGGRSSCGSMQGTQQPPQGGYYYYPTPQQQQQSNQRQQQGYNSQRTPNYVTEMDDSMSSPATPASPGMTPEQSRRPQQPPRTAPSTTNPSSTSSAGTWGESSWQGSSSNPSSTNQWGGSSNPSSSQWGGSNSSSGQWGGSSSGQPNPRGY